MVTYLVMAIVIGYLFGCLQTSFFIGKMKNIDIRKHGNSNAGASNTTIVLGWKYGILVGLVDILKATAAVILMAYIVKETGFSMNEKNLMVYLTGAFVIIGHNYPFYMGFKGGKGTASLVGMLLALDWKMALIGIASIVLVTIITNYIVFGTILLYISFIVCTALLGFGNGAIGVAVLLTVLSIYKHWPNLVRIKEGTETGLRSTIGKKNKEQK